MLHLTTDSRQTLAFLLASLGTCYPDAQFFEDMPALLEHPGLNAYCQSVQPEIWDELRDALEQIFIAGATAKMELQGAYNYLFDSHHKRHSVYETEYGAYRSVKKTAELADVAGFYRAFGMEIKEDEVGREMLDHISVELEFYSVLLCKQQWLEQHQDQAGIDIVVDARKQFLKAHLGTYVTTLASSLQDAQYRFYTLLFAWVNNLVMTECRNLGVQPDQTLLPSGKTEEEAIACGTLGACAMESLKPKYSDRS